MKLTVYKPLNNFTLKRIIVDYKKLTPEILDVLTEKYPEGYGLKDIIRFTNAKGQYIEALEVRLEDAIYLVKISDELADTMEDYDNSDDTDDAGIIDDDIFPDVDEVLDEDI